MERNLILQEIEQLKGQGCRAENWNEILVGEHFNPSKIWNCQFRGQVRIGNNVYISNIGSYIANYIIEDDVYIENTGVIETLGESTFGNGVEIAAVNEAGGREVPIHDGLDAQTAYITAMYRHRTKTIDRIMELTETYCNQIKSTLGVIGRGASVRGCNTLLNAKIGPYAQLRGVSVVENCTLNSCQEDPVMIGFGVKAHDFIAMPGARIDNGTILKHCFVGEAVHLDNGFMAENSLFFANCECGSGEACSIFAGPYTVTHHRSSLLIAGIFSFFNAGSGTNQSNHLFKTGAVHQGVHQRGCKFASNAYAMLPAKDGAFTVIFGRHSSHYNTEYFPFSYLMDSEGKSYLLPGANLRCYGMVRDIAKWPKRDRRKGPKTDLINFREHTPYLAERVVKALEISAQLLEKKDQDTYNYERMRIKQAMLRRGVYLYELALDGSIGAILDETRHVEADPLGAGVWVDMAGMYAPKAVVETVLDTLDEGKINSLDALYQELKRIHNRYPQYARGWALHALANILKHSPNEEEIETAINKGSQAMSTLKAMTDEDAQRDKEGIMSTGYGIDAVTPEEIDQDFAAVKQCH